MSKLSPFHLAIPVKDLSESKNFYQNILGCKPFCILFINLESKEVAKIKEVIIETSIMPPINIYFFIFNSLVMIL